MGNESLYDAAERQLRKEYMRFKGAEVAVTTPEQLEKMRATNPDATPNVQMVVTWEPLSYRKEGGKYGNTETDYLRMSVGNLTEEEAERVRTAYWRGIPSDKRMSIPKASAEARRPWERWMIKAKAAGLRMEIGDDGNFTSPDIDQVFEVEAGFDTFPQWIPGKGKGDRGHWSDADKGEKVSSPYVRYPVAKAEGYVQPEDVPVRFVNNTDDDDAAPAVTSSGTTSNGGVSGGQLAAAFAEAGLIGAAEADFQSAAAQVNVTNKFGGKAPVLFLPEVQTAAAAGNLLAFGIERGAITVEDGVIKAAA